MGDQQNNNNNLPDLKTILECGPAVVYHCRQYWEYGINYMSPNVTQMLGWSVDDFLSDTHFRQQLIHDEDLPFLLRDIHNLYEKGQQKHEYRMRKKDGSYIWILDDARCLYDDDGAVTGIVGYLSDITASKSKDRYLKESELRYRAIFETVLEGIITIDERGIIQDMNKTAEEIFGFLRTEVIGRNVSVLMPTPDADKHDAYMHSYLSSHRPKIIGIGRNLKGVRKNGEIFDMHLSVSEVNLPGGKNFVGCVRDISQRILAERELKTSQERLRMSQQFAKIGSWDWHLDTDQLYWSEQVPPLLGLEKKPDELRFERCEEWIYPDDLERVKAAVVDCLKNGVEYNSTHRVIWPNGTVRWVHEQGNVIRGKDGRAMRMIGVVQDVTDAQLRQQELDRAREQADDANKAKSEFLSRMSHELRTPLNAILGFAQLLGISRKEPLTERQGKQVAQIVSAGQHLLDLINEILDLAKIEAGRLSLSFEPVNLNPVMDDCLDFCQTLASEKAVEIKVEGDLDHVLVADRTRLKQVILNLLSNAIKYNNPEGHVWVKAEKINDSHVRIGIKDNGPGIDPKYHHQVFKPFNRLGAEFSTIEGTGIGLTLTKQLVEIMNGTIDFESEPGKGTHFWFDLQLSEALEDASEPMFVSKLDLDSPRKLLYIEDNQENIDLMAQIVNMVGHLDMVAIQKPKEALKKLPDIKPDLILIDVNLGEMDGVELTEIIAHHPDFTHVPIFVLSANDQEDVRESALKAGADEYFMKPLNISQFIGKLTSLWSEKI